MPRETRILSNVPYDITENLYQDFCDFIGVALDLVSHSDDRLFVNGEINSALLGCVKKIINEIYLVEEKLLDKFPDYDPNIRNYRPRSILDSMWRFIRRFNNLLDTDNFK
jgi:hypothetical protein